MTEKGQSILFSVPSTPPLSAHPNLTHCLSRAGQVSLQFQRRCWRAEDYRRAEGPSPLMWRSEPVLLSLKEKAGLAETYLLPHPKLSDSNDDSLSFLLVFDVCLQDLFLVLSTSCSYILSGIKPQCGIYELNPTPKVWSASSFQLMLIHSDRNREAKKCQCLSCSFIQQTFLEHLLHASHCAGPWKWHCEPPRSDFCMLWENVQKRWKFLPLPNPPLSPEFYGHPIQEILSQLSFHKSPMSETPKYPGFFNQERSS